MFLARTGRLPTLHGLALTAQLLSALEFAHRHDRVHGAIEPAQLIVEPCGRLKVAGYGVPVRERGHAASAHTDLHSAAGVAHLLLSGELPGRERPQLPPGLQAVFTRALAAEPERRFPHAAALSAALRNAVGQPVWDPQRRQSAAQEPAIAAKPVPIPPAPKEPSIARPLAARQAHARSVPRRPLLIAAGVAALFMVAVLAMRQDDAEGPLDVATVDAHEEVVIAEPSRPAPPAAESQPAIVPVPAAIELAQERPATQQIGAAPEVKAVRADRGRNAAPQPARRSAVLRTASASRGPELGCQQDFALSREVCTALRCATAEFRSHPICVRLSAHQRTVNAQREMLGGR